MGRASRAKRRPSSPRFLYHFTSEHHLREIISEGKLTLTKSNTSISGDGEGDPKVLWLLDQSSADGAHHGLEPDPRNVALIEQAKARGMKVANADKREVRFTVPVGSARRWTEWVKGQKQERVQTRRGVWLASDVLIASGGGAEAASHWWVTEREVPASEWIEVAYRPNPGDPYLPITWNERAS